jgi:DNA-binding transcriptional ArsR family regulator
VSVLQPMSFNWSRRNVQNLSLTSVSVRRQGLSLPIGTVLDKAMTTKILYLMVEYGSDLDMTFGALADPTRRAILAALSSGQASVTELARPHNMSLPAVIKHLQVLERAGLILQTKTGRVRQCRLAVEPLKQASDWLHSCHSLENPWQ